MADESRRPRVPAVGIARMPALFRPHEGMGSLPLDRSTPVHEAGMTEVRCPCRPQAGVKMYGDSLPVPAVAEVQPGESRVVPCVCAPVLKRHARHLVWITVDVGYPIARANRL